MSSSGSGSASGSTGASGSGSTSSGSSGSTGTAACNALALGNTTPVSVFPSSSPPPAYPGAIVAADSYDLGPSGATAYATTATDAGTVGESWNLSEDGGLERVIALDDGGAVAENDTLEVCESVLLLVPTCGGSGNVLLESSGDATTFGGVIDTFDGVVDRQLSPNGTGSGAALADGGADCTGPSVCTGLGTYLDAALITPDTTGTAPTANNTALVDGRYDLVSDTIYGATATGSGWRRGTLRLSGVSSVGMGSGQTGTIEIVDGVNGGAASRGIGTFTTVSATSALTVLSTCTIGTLPFGAAGTTTYGFDPTGGANGSGAINIILANPGAGTTEVLEYDAP